MPRTRPPEPDDDDSDAGDNSVYDDDFDNEPFDPVTDDNADEAFDGEFDDDPNDPETYPAGVYADDDRPTIPCPHCRTEIDEDSPQCPRCGYYLSTEDTALPGEPKSLLWMVLMALALAAAVSWAVWG
jgi:hypothetical protein